MLFQICHEEAKILHPKKKKENEKKKKERESGMTHLLVFHRDQGWMDSGSQAFFWEGNPHHKC